MTTAPAKTLTLKTAIATYGHTSTLKDGSIKPDGIQFDHIEVSPIIAAFRRMVRTLEFDVSEMAITTYLTARAHNKPFTALPVVLVRAFHHGAISYNVKSGITQPKDLEGKRVGVRAYTVTQGVWARGVLATEYGVDLDKVTWVLVDEEHVLEYKVPPNVVTAEQGKTLPDMLKAGEIAAAIGAGPIDSPDIKPLISNVANAQAEWYKKTGIYPINHMVVVKDSLLQSDPWIGPALFAAFKSAKEGYLKHLSSGGQLSEADEAFVRVKNIVGDDPLPYGLKANRKSLEAVIQMAYDQKILPRKYSPEEMFISNTLDLE